MKPQSIDTARLIRRASILALAVAGLQACNGSGSPSSLYNVNEKIGFPLTAAAMAAPDGLDTDAGWGDAYTVRLEDGAPVAAGSVKSLADANNIYIFAQVEDSDLADGNDALVLGLNPTNGADDYRKLVIYPCAGVGGGVCGTGATLTPSVDYQTGSTSSGSLVWAAPISGTPAGFDIKSSSAPGSPSLWTVEIKIDRAGLGIPATNYFGLFVDAIATDNGSFGVPAFANNFSWPTGTILSNSAGSIDAADMQVPRWGNATLDAAKFDAGVQIVGFSTDGVDPSRIDLNDPNRFFATVANYAMGTGAEPTANNVAATFKINNIGLNPSWTWTDIPTSGNPTGGVPIPAKEAKVLSPDPWTLLTSGNYQGSGQTEQAFFTANPHQCVKVEVTSTGNPMVQRQYNMNFVTVNSPFQSAPQIASGIWRRGFERASAIYLTEQFYGAGAELSWRSRFGGAEPLTEHAWILKSLDGDAARLEVAVEPDDSLRVPLDDYQLDVASLAAGKVADVRVRPGTVLTLLAEGEATMDGRPVTPWGSGFLADGRKAEGENADGVADALRPGAMIAPGTLIGSFDGFRTSFAIGSGTTLYVPASAQALQVRIAGKPREMQGRWAMQAVSGPANRLTLGGLDPRRLREGKNPILLPLGMNLPFHVVRGTLNTGETIEIRGKRFDVTTPMGSFGHFIYRANAGPLFRPSGATGPVTGRPDAPIATRTLAPVDGRAVRTRPSGTPN
jgi:hypothetical protein